MSGEGPGANALGFPHSSASLSTMPGNAVGPVHEALTRHGTGWRRGVKRLPRQRPNKGPTLASNEMRSGEENARNAGARVGI
jgi:hypothetical protein